MMILAIGLGNNLLASAAQCGVARLMRGVPNIVGRKNKQDPTKIVEVHGLTLIELIVVLALLGIVLSVGAPMLAKFFRGRELDNEVNRFLAMTRYARERAINEGIPIIIQIDTENRLLALAADPSFVAQDPDRQEFSIALGVTITVQGSVSSLAGAASQLGVREGALEGGQIIRFMPDGFIAIGAPSKITFVDKDGFAISVVPNHMRTWYEIETTTSSGFQR